MNIPILKTGRVDIGIQAGPNGSSVHGPSRSTLGAFEKIQIIAWVDWLRLWRHKAQSMQGVTVHMYMYRYIYCA